VLPFHRTGKPHPDDNTSLRKKKEASISSTTTRHAMQQGSPANGNSASLIRLMSDMKGVSEEVSITVLSQWLVIRPFRDSMLLPFRTPTYIFVRIVGIFSFH